MTFLEKLPEYLAKQKQFPCDILLSDENKNIVYNLLETCKNLGYDAVISSNVTKHETIIWHLRVIGKTDTREWKSGTSVSYDDMVKMVESWPCPYCGKIVGKLGNCQD